MSSTRACQTPLVSLSSAGNWASPSPPPTSKVKKPYIAEGNKALNPYSRAPKTAVKFNGDPSKELVRRICQHMAAAGRDHGPQSIWFEGVDTGEFGGQIPSDATFGRIFAEAGVTKTNSRKRPRRTWMRFSWSFPMEMWQSDGLEYRPFNQDATKALIYQLLDDGTRFDVGTRFFARLENSDEAIVTLSAAFEEYGISQEKLSDNGLSFNQARRGTIWATESFLAKHGCRGITGCIWHSQT